MQGHLLPDIYIVSEWLLEGLPYASSKRSDKMVVSGFWRLLENFINDINTDFSREGNGGGGRNSPRQ